MQEKSTYAFVEVDKDYFELVTIRELKSSSELRKKVAWICAKR